jgi:rod shape-determining protein MreD
MAESTSWRTAGNRFLFFLLNMLGIFILLVPTTMMPSSLVWPEVMLLLTFALVLRSPESVPVWLIWGCFILSDVLLSQPLGLGAFIALLASQFLKRNSPAFVEMLFLGEWFSISLLVIAASLAREFLLIITLAERTPWWGIASQVGLSIIVYPAVVGVVSVLFRATKTEENMSYPVRRTT